MLSNNTFRCLDAIPSSQLKHKNTRVGEFSMQNPRVPPPAVDRHTILSTADRNKIRERKGILSSIQQVQGCPRDD